MGSGGSKSSNESGYSALSPELKKVFDPMGKAAAQYTNPNNAGVTEMFTPMGQTEGETAAIEAMNAGFTPTAESLQSDISMQMNPYQSSVIDEINRQAGGDYSLLKESLGEVGQMGSNRQILGANDIDLSRQNQIGTFLTDQYNTSLNNSMNTLPTLRNQDATNQMSSGTFQRNLNSATKVAPVTALQAGTSLMSPFISGGSGTSSSSNQSPIWSLLSDKRYKEDIKKVGVENGHNIYEFKYIGGKNKYIGVIAQEVEKINPNGVWKENGVMGVKYDVIGVKFRRAA